MESKEQKIALTLRYQPLVAKHYMHNFDDNEGPKYVYAVNKYDLKEGEIKSINRSTHGLVSITAYGHTIAYDILIKFNNLRHYRFCGDSETWFGDEAKFIAVALGICSIEGD